MNIFNYFENFNKNEKNDKITKSNQYHLFVNYIKKEEENNM
jgi:hypothetical protein